MKRLNETGVGGETTCPYCGFDNAMDEYESRGQFTYNGKHEYTNMSFCYLCGWQKYWDDESNSGDEDDETNYEGEINVPPNYEGEINVPPKPIILKEAKRIIKKIYDKLPKNSHASEVFFDFVLEYGDYKSQYKSYQFFMIGMIGHIWQPQ